MKVEIIENLGLGKLVASGGKAWNAFYDQSQKITIKITAESEDDLGKWGLTQTLLASTRRANYDGGVTMSIVPAQGKACPCLDGGAEMIPWYNFLCEEKELIRIGYCAGFQLENHPEASDIPAVAEVVDAESGIISETSHNIICVYFEERFLVTLYRREDNRKLRQWLWGYSFALGVNGRASAKPLAASGLTGPMVEISPVAELITEGPVARDAPQTIWRRGSRILSSRLPATPGPLNSTASSIPGQDGMVAATAQIPSPPDAQN